MFLPLERRNATVAELLRRGHAERIFISQNFCATIDWFPPEAEQGLVEAGLVRDWSMTLVFEQVLPTLREEGSSPTRTTSRSSARTRGAGSAPERLPRRPQARAPSRSG